MSRWSPEGEHQLWYDVNVVLNRYARGVDRMDWELMLSAFHDDALDNHGAGFVSPRDFVASFAPAQEHVESCQHLNGQVLLLEIDRDRQEVLVETYCVGFQRLRPGAPSHGPLFVAPHISADLPSGRLLSVGNRYFDVITEREGTLAIERREVIYEWMHVEHSDDQQGLQGRTLARRSSSDVSRLSIRQFRERSQGVSV